MGTSSDARRYRLVRVLGRGGMAQVFEAVASGEGGFERRVAIKQILADHRGDPSVTRSFFDEARLAGSLHHGGIVSVLDYGTAEGTPFQVLELVDGRDAGSLARAAWRGDRELPAVLALHLCREVAHALHYAHEARDAAGRPLGLVHRDVKPGNILVSWSGDVKLGDFGIAFAAERSEHTLGGAKGTPAYMSPEQVRGGAVDRRADVFSLGCVLAALLTGESPMSAADAYARVLAGVDPALDPDLPADARAIVAIATRADREARYRTAAEMAEALGEAVLRRSTRDVKSELIDWLAGSRAPAPAAPERARAGRLDALLGAELILPGDGDEVREGTLRIPEPAGDAALPERPPPPDRTVALPPPEQRAPSPVGEVVPPELAIPSVPVVSTPPWRLRAVALAAALALAVVAGMWFTRAPRAPSVPEASASTAAAPPSVEPSATAEVVTPPEPTSSAAPPTVAVAPRPRPPTASASARPATAPTQAEPSPSARPVAAPTQPVAPQDLGIAGTLAVGGPVGATVLVDGAPRGLTPKYIQLPLGPHRVQVTRADGAALGGATLTLRADHTASSPLRWSPAAP